MQKLIERSKNRLRDFINQRKTMLLLVRCADRDTAFLLKMLQDLDEESEADLFVLTGGTFRDQASYVNSVIEQLKVEHKAACEAVVVAGKPSLQPLPPELEDNSLLPAERLRKAFEFTGECLVQEDGRYLVWSLVPDSIFDRQEYLELVASAAFPGEITGWMRRMRLVVRDEAALENHESAELLLPQKKIEQHEIDFGPAAMDAAMSEEMADESLPMETRMQSLLFTALIDVAHNRAAIAKEKLDYLLSYYQSTDNPMLQALVINARGDLSERLSSLEEAEHWYKCAVEPAAESKNPIILSCVIRNLGNVAFKTKNYAAAEQHFDGLDKLSSTTLDSEAKSFALEQKGLCQEKQGRLKDAIETWKVGAKLCRSLKYEEGFRIHLKHLERALEKSGRRISGFDQEFLTMESEGS